MYTWLNTAQLLKYWKQLGLCLLTQQLSKTQFCKDMASWTGTLLKGAHVETASYPGLVICSV